MFSQHSFKHSYACNKIDEDIEDERAKARLKNFVTLLIHGYYKRVVFSTQIGPNDPIQIIFKKD